MSKHVTFCTWDDAPHLSEAVKAELWASIPDYQRDARSKGIPQLGSGAVYPLQEADIRVPRFEIPSHWPRGFGADHGWNFFAAAFVARDPETSVRYVYDVYKRSKAEPAIHAAALKARIAFNGNDTWMPGVMDAADISKTDGQQFIQIYRSFGLNLELPNKAVERGIHAMWGELSAGRLRVFADLAPFFDEYRIYRRDEKGMIVKENDHILDAVRYQVMADVLTRMAVPPLNVPRVAPVGVFAGPQAWMS